MESSIPSNVRPRPLYDLCHLLLRVNSDGTAPDLEAASPDLLEEIARTAETVIQTVQLGIRGTAEMMALSAPDTAASDWPSSTLESVGWLIAELSDFSAVCHCLQTLCLSRLPPSLRQDLSKPDLLPNDKLPPLR
jgi:hypothetical protein